MLTLKTQIRNDKDGCILRNQTGQTNRWSGGKSAFTLTELIIAIVVLAMFSSLAMTNIMGLLIRSTTKGQLQELASVMQLAATSATESDKRYEVIIDLDEQKYMLRQITSPDLSVVLKEEIITEKEFGSNCDVIYIDFDDGDYTNNGQAKFRAGRAGWQYGGRIVFVDNDDQEYSVVVNRISNVVEVQKGIAVLLGPKTRDDLPF